MFIRELFENSGTLSPEEKLKAIIRNAADALNIRTANIDSAEFKQGRLVAIKLKDGGSIPVPPDWDKKWVKDPETDKWEKTGTVEPKNSSPTQPKNTDSPSFLDRIKSIF